MKMNQCALGLCKPPQSPPPPNPTLPLSFSPTPIKAFGFRSNAKSAYRSPLWELHVNCSRTVRVGSIMFLILTSSISLITDGCAFSLNHTCHVLPNTLDWTYPTFTLNNIGLSIICSSVHIV